MELPAPAPTPETPSAETEIEYASMTPARWAEAEALYERGVASGAEICAKYGIKPSTWKTRLWRRKQEGRPIIKNSKVEEIKKATEEAVSAASSELSAAAKFALNKRDRIGKFRELAIIQATAIGVEFNRILSDIRKPSATGAVIRAADKHPDIKAMKDLGKGMIANYNWAMRDVLQADKEIDEDQLPQLIFRDLSQEDIEIIRRKNDDEDENDLGDVPIDDEKIVEEGT